MVYIILYNTNDNVFVYGNGLKVLVDNSLNSFNINKTNNHLSPQIIEHKNITTHGTGNAGPDFGQAKICGSVTPVHFRSQPPPLLIIKSPTTIHK